jgi:hypothetical protein
MYNDGSRFKHWVEDSLESTWTSCGRLDPEIAQGRGREKMKNGIDMERATARAAGCPGVHRRAFIRLCTVGLGALAIAGPATSLMAGGSNARAFSARCSGTVNLATNEAAAK